MEDGAALIAEEGRNGRVVERPSVRRRALVISASGDDPAPRQLSLSTLSRGVRDARVAVHRHRHGPVVATELASARRALMTALEEYTSALEQRHLPVPHALHLELQLHQQLFDE